MDGSKRSAAKRVAGHSRRFVAGAEGLVGLQRAFQVAGACTTIANLWKVEDSATHTLIVELYKNLWEKKLGKLAALR